MNEETLTAQTIGNSLTLDRRGFLKILGGGIIICFTPALSVSEEDAWAAVTHELPQDFNAFLRIGEDGRVTCFTGKVELGQGIGTALAQILAEELDVPCDAVNMIMGDTDLCPWDSGTHGSRSVKYFGPVLRDAAAEARAVLVELAAERLKVPPERLKTRGGIIYDTTTPDKGLSYGELTKGKSIERRLKQKPVLKPVTAYVISGTPAPRKDAVDKVTGKAKFAADISQPGMLYAGIVRPPAHGALIRNVDTSAADKIPGARIVRDGDLIAVLHTSPDEAAKALKLIKFESDKPKTNLNDDTIFEHLVTNAPAGTVLTKAGDLTQGKKLTSQAVDAVYQQGYVAHAPLETHTAAALPEKGRIIIWASTQRPFGAREEVAQALSMPEENVHIVTPQVGGGFGGKNNNQQVVEAARLAKLTGKPVQVAWTREEEFFFDTFQPAGVIKIFSGLDNAGRISFWDYHAYACGAERGLSFYDIPHNRTTIYGRSWIQSDKLHPFATGPWRGPEANTNNFARESHMDALAVKAGVDPLEFRLSHLKDERMIRVLNTAANAFGWVPAVGPSGKGQGLACIIYKGTYVVTAAKVAVDKNTGQCRVKRMVCVQDMGRVINPDGAKAQMEGCIMMGLGYALTETIHFRGGEILDRNFDTYEIPKFSDMPKIETIIISNPDTPPQEGGEPAITGMGAVIANAVFDAVGVRHHRLPMTPERTKEALKS